MVYVLIQSSCEDYARWRFAFDERDDIRRAAGAGDYQVFQDAADPNQITVLLTFGYIEDAQRFMTSDDLRQAMMRSGIVGQPQVHFLIPA